MTYFYFCMTVCTHERMCILMCACSIGGQKRRSHALILELQMLVSCLVVLGTEPGPMQKKKLLLNSELCLYLLVSYCQKYFSYSYFVHSASPGVKLGVIRRDCLVGVFFYI